jgi:hypothetical protein
MQRMLVMHTAMKASIITGARTTHHIGQSLDPMAQLLWRPLAELPKAAGRALTQVKQG